MKRYTWFEICDMAENAAHLSKELKAKDQARGDLASLMQRCGYGDPEITEVPEEAIEAFLLEQNGETGKNIMFDDRGNLIYDSRIKKDPLKDVFIFIPTCMQIIRIAEGIGDNLLHEDIEEGYVDYLIYEIYDLDQGMPENDGGMLLLKAYAYEKYDSLMDAANDILCLAYEGYIPAYRRLYNAA